MSPLPATRCGFAFRAAGLWWSIRAWSRWPDVARLQILIDGVEVARFDSERFEMDPTVSGRFTLVAETPGTEAQNLKIIDNKIVLANEPGFHKPEVRTPEAPRRNYSSSKGIMVGI